ncbi:MAG: tRNA lysidine(34) synthetase TilS, partial [Candidatus Binataceae bacterium]
VTALAEGELRRAVTSDGTLDVARLARLHPALASAVIRRFLRVEIGDLRRVSRAHIEAVRRLVLTGPPNGGVDLPGGWRLERRYGTIRLGRSAPRRAAKHAAALNISGKAVVPVEEAGFLFEGEIVVGKAPAMPESLFEAIFDADQLAGGIRLRTWAPGDRVRPLGMDGHRKVKDVFIDHKVPRAFRATFPIVALGSEIAWIPGLVRGHAGAVTPGTRRVLHLRATPVAPASVPPPARRAVGGDVACARHAG